MEWVIGTELGAEGGAYQLYGQQHVTGRERGGGRSAGVKNLRRHAQGDPDRQPRRSAVDSVHQEKSRDLGFLGR